VCWLLCPGDDFTGLNSSSHSTGPTGLRSDDCGGTYLTSSSWCTTCNAPELTPYVDAKTTEHGEGRMMTVLMTPSHVSVAAWLGGKNHQREDYIVLYTGILAHPSYNIPVE
jgi:hypothetical protein